MSLTIYLNLFPLFVCQWIDVVEEGKRESFIPLGNKRGTKARGQRLKEGARKKACAPGVGTSWTNCRAVPCPTRRPRADSCPRTKSHVPSSHASTDPVQISEQLQVSDYGTLEPSNCKEGFLSESWKSNTWNLHCGYKAADTEKPPREIKQA